MRRLRTLSATLSCVSFLFALIACAQTKERANIISTTDEASITQMSHRLLNAYAQMDEAAVNHALASSFALFEDGRVDGRDAVLTNIQKRKERHAEPRSLTWLEHHVTISGPTAVFLGQVRELIPAEGERIASDIDGWNTVVWTWGGTKWEATYWQWQQGGMQAAREMWNTEYSAGTGFNTKPNKLLTEVARSLKPAMALDVGMGQGRNSIYLASLGWSVTGIDISDVGLRIARETAAQRKLTIEAFNADMDTWDYGKEKWDLVTRMYIRPDDSAFPKIKASLRHGGSIVVEGFHKPRAQNWEAGQLAALFNEGYKIVRDEVVEDLPDWGPHPEKLVRFVATKQ